VKESELRGYIRKEILLAEAAGDFSAQDIKDVWKSFTDVFRVFGTAIKSLLSVLVLNVELIFRTDPQAIEEAFRKYDARAGEVAMEYNTIIGPIKEQFGEVEPLLFVANPGAYVAYQFAKEGSSGFVGPRTFLKDVGVDVENSKWLSWAKTAMNLDLDDPKDRATADTLGIAAGMSATAGTAASPERMEATQKKIQQTLDNIFGLLSRQTEGVILEQKGESIPSMLSKFYSEGLKNFPPETFGVDSEAVSKVVKLKREEADSFARTLEAPVSFLQKLAAAKTIEQVKSAIETLNGTPYSIDGVKQLTPEFLESSAKKAVDAAKKKNKIDDLFKQIGIKTPEKEEQMIEAVKAYQLRNLLGKTVVDAKASIVKQTEELRKQYLEKYQSDTPLDTLEKVAPGSELEKTVKAGIEKIRNAGKRGA